MKIEKQPIENHQIKLTVEVEPEVLEEAKQQAARHLARRVKVPGFRPGKAPYAVILRQVGEAAVLEDAIEHLVDDIYPKVIEESGIKPYGPGSLDNIVSTEPPVFEFVVPLEAEVQLGDYASVRKPYEPPETTDEQVNEVLENLRERQAIMEPVERPAQEGDMVTVKVSGTRTQPEEGKNPELIREQSMPIFIKPADQPKKENEPEEWPYPGFSTELVGMAKGEEKTVPHTFPEDSRFESLRGVEAEFHIVMEEVKSRQLPELNDEFAGTVGEFGDMEALRKEIRSSLEQQALDTYHEKYDDELIEEVIQGATIEYPPQMLQRELDSMIENLKNRISQQNLDMDLYLKMRNLDMDGLRKETEPLAEERLKKSLVLVELAKAENVEVSPDEVRNEASRTMVSLLQSMSDKEAKKFANQNVYNNVVESVMADLLFRKAEGRLREIGSDGKWVEPKAPEAAASETTEATADEEAEATSDTGAGESQPANPVAEQPEASQAGQAVEAQDETPGTESGAAEGDSEGADAAENTAALTQEES